MLQITGDFKEKVVGALLDARGLFDGSDSDFARKFGMGPAIWSRIKGGERERVLADAKWLNVGRELGVHAGERSWKMARTRVFKFIEEDVLFCKEQSKGMMLADDCGIGKTYAARYLSRTVRNCFYVDCSQYHTVNELIRGLARAVGVDERGTLREVRENTKYYLNGVADRPVVIVDEAGDLGRNQLRLVKEYWNATEHRCGWYLMGANDFRAMMKRGVRGEAGSFEEVFSRQSESYHAVVPRERGEKIAFYKELITAVLTVNLVDKGVLGKIVNRCLTMDDGHIGGLRRAESLLILNS